MELKTDMSTDLIQLPDEVARLLDAAARRVRRIYVLRGLAVTGAVFVVLTLAAMAADAFFVIFDDRVRYAITAALYLLTALAVFRFVLGPFRHPISRRRAARVLDERHPENEERLTALVEIAESSKRSGDTTSAGLYGVLAREGVICAHRLSVEKEFTARTIKRRLIALGVVLLLALLSFVVFPNVAGLLAIRALAPWVDVGNLYADCLEVTPGSVAVLKGSTIEIRAKTLKALPGHLTIRISRRQGRGWGPEFAEDLSPEGYKTTADLKERLWRYRVSCGPAVSRYYTVRVCELPRYRQFTATLDYPEYTGLARRAYTNESVGAIQAIEGTRVRFALDIDEPGTTGELRLNGGGLTRLADDGRLEETMVSNRVAAWSMELTNADGFKSPKKGGPFVSVPDRPPVIVIECPDRAVKLPPHAKLPIVATLNDDVGLHDIALRCSMNDDPFTEMRRDEIEGGRAFVKCEKEIDLSLFDLTDVARIRFDFVVTDRYPEELGGPHAATSTPVTVNFDVYAHSFGEQSLERQVKDVCALFHEAEKRLETGERLARETRNEVANARENIAESTERKIEQLAHEIAETEKRAEELADRFEETGTFEPLAEELREFAEDELAPARAKVEEAQFAAKDARVDALEKTDPILKEAREKLIAAEAELKARAEKLATYERTKDLAERQEALAKAAERIVHERPVDTRKLDAWKRMEEAAVRTADEINRAAKDERVAAAQQKMRQAARQMEDLREEIKIDQDKNLKDADKSKRMEQRQLAERIARDNALRDAIRHEKQAEQNLAQALERAETAAKTEDLNQRAQRVREMNNLVDNAADLQRRAEDNLMTAEAKDAPRAALQKAEAARAEVKDAGSDRVAALKEALAAQRAAREALDKDAERLGLKDHVVGEKDVKIPAVERKNRDAAARAQAIASLERAEKAEEKALDAMRLADAAAIKTAQDEAAKAIKEARAAYAANALDEAERLQRTAADQTPKQDNPNNDNHWRNAQEAQKNALRELRKAADTLAADAGEDRRERAEERRGERAAERIRAAQLDAERLGKRAVERIKANDPGNAAIYQQQADKAADRAEGLIAAQREKAEREEADDLEEALEKAAASEHAAIEAQDAAAKARENFHKTRSGGNKEKIDAAQAAAVKAQEEAVKAQQQASADMAAAAAMMAGDDGEEAKKSEPSADASAEAQAPSGFAADQLAEAAADDLESAVGAQQTALGIVPPPEADEDGDDGAKKGGEKKNEQGGQGAKKKSDDESKGGGGGSFKKVMAEMNEELKRNDIPEELKGRISRKAWYRIRGSVKEGLGERDLKNVPPEYRDLVRRYFLRLADPASSTPKK